MLRSIEYVRVTTRNEKLLPFHTLVTSNAAEIFINLNVKAMFKAQIDFKKYICPQVSVLSAMSDSAVFK
jgi:hypothetical protein